MSLPRRSTLVLVPLSTISERGVASVVWCLLALNTITYSGVFSVQSICSSNVLGVDSSVGARSLRGWSNPPTVEVVWFFRRQVLIVGWFSVALTCEVTRLGAVSTDEVAALRTVVHDVSLRFADVAGASLLHERVVPTGFATDRHTSHLIREDDVHQL